MMPADQLLVKRLGVVLVIKLVLLFGLWWGFVRDQRVTVDASGMAAQALVQGSVSIEGDNK
ncbi:MAG: hypothetical protein PHQ58_09545 [Rhodoferax sp.]|uniref:cytochrome oxidase putative small subunit CydP n=1 Tax=Rhodoferax sp. TaxID=50421 RepID=UPI0026348099|nr:cytochrome oxidase putative small subunit CydP [Rhodoferax sp.]MDD2880671.1 hypothetical protein [Rhodoferax sp.]